MDVLKLRLLPYDAFYNVLMQHDCTEYLMMLIDAI